MVDTQQQKVPFPVEIGGITHGVHMAVAVNDTMPSIDIDNLKPYVYAGQKYLSPWDNSIYDGGKFSGGFGETQIFDVDYWTLRARSAQLFTENLYARGIVRRLITNEINTGIVPETTPDEGILGLPDGALHDWSETVESRYAIWAKNPLLCDYKQEKTLGALQRQARLESLVEGDVLVVLHQSTRHKLPMIQLIKGSCVRTPFGTKHSIRDGHKIIHGVEKNARGIVVAHWVEQEDSTFKRLPARGERSGRRISWLEYGTDKRLDDVRGQPLLALVLQSLKEIDRYRDSTQRKAVINSIIALSVEKTEERLGSLPITGGATRKNTAQVSDESAPGTPRQFNITQHIPGTVIEELQFGETLNMHGSGGTDLDFGAFEDAIMQTVAWANEIPPEILRLAFTNNYSASQAAINEFKIYLNKFWSSFGESFCTPIYVEFLISETLTSKIITPGFLDAWRDPQQYDIFGAYISVEWYGSIKPSTDMLKQVNASEKLVKGGFSTRARETRGTTGTKFSKNVKRLERENQQLVKAMRPLAEFKAEFGTDPTEDTIDETITAMGGNILQLVDNMEVTI